jgi:hypothetical protein
MKVGQKGDRTSPIHPENILIPCRAAAHHFFSDANLLLYF